MNGPHPENRTEEEELFRFSVSEAEDGTRLDRLLAALVEDCSRSYLARLVEEGNVRVNGAVCTVKKRAVRTGDDVSLRLDPPRELSAEPEDIPLDIVYEDGDLLVVNKPKGLVVHPAAGTPSGTLVNALLWHCRGNLSSINGVIRPGIVHRIDKDTSGLLVIAKTDAAHKSLSDQLAAHTVTRAYRAICAGVLKEDAGTINRPIGRDPKNRLRNACTAPARPETHLTEGYPLPAGSREAVTHWTVLERLRNATYLECRLETGRTHQIRVHLASIGHPLAGDPLYGRKDGTGAKTQMLHAGLLGFVHPSSGAYMEFTSPLPADFEALLSRLRNS
jgi:23S rRNA pseudouridine1911/1915/1917 synthase